MARHPSKHPTELELEILKVLWRESPLPVRAVREALEDFRELAHTSVMTIMNIMVDKGYLTRKKESGRYVYRPQVSQEGVRQSILCDLVERLFEGSASSAVVNLLKTSDIDEEELDILRDIIKEKGKGEAS